MYINFEVYDTKDFADLIEEELFKHATDEEAADVLLDIINRYFNYYHKEDK